ncbi:hypothetical protein RclHR1_19570003 [Rhizophagus clarus]|uniref:Ribonuclease H-like domain-containing protein n=1 Tax=Rhizophagus clarus TaxID=94130 RepID=A0A2Z6QPP1_9GLOM|nr:hypothetical protein RclHR1_19570003 [Rhizophagus clarus]GES72695.1 ribonuclease H-like domain-containing protein [Rhizophagus clarus]
MNLTKKTYFLTLSLQTLSAQALLDFNTRTNQLSHLSYSFYNPNHNSSNTSLVHNMSHSCKFLDLFFLDNNSITSLNRIAYSISQCDNIIFYTDGSYSTDYSTTSSMGLGWLITNIDATQLSFSCRANKFPTLTKTESLALVSALTTCPANSSVTINTDSKCIIDTFTYLSTNPLTRRFQKCNNYLIWAAIFKIIKSHYLTVTLTKVKAYSDDKYNNKADALANQGRCSTTYIDVRPMTVNVNTYFMWNLPKCLNPDNILPLVIDRNIRHAIVDITNFKSMNNFLARHRITNIMEASYNNIIDWKFTKDWFNHNPIDNFPTSRKLTKFRAWQIKNCSNSLPTMDILAKYNPDLFSEQPLCWHCMI